MAKIEDLAFLNAFGVSHPISARTLWQQLLNQTFFNDPETETWKKSITTILDHGCLANRILTAYLKKPDRDNLESIYRRLNLCLMKGQLFEA